MFQPLLSGEKIGQTDANAEQWWGYNIQQSLIKDQTIYMWSSNELSGYPIYTFETFFSFFKQGIFCYIFKDISFHTVENNLFLIHYIFFSLAIYAFFRRMGINRLLSLFTSIILFFVSTIIHAPLNGAFRPAFATSLIPIVALLFVISLKDAKYWILTSLFMLIVFFHHPMYGANISLIIPVCYIIYKALNKFKFNKNEIKYVTISSIIFIIIVSFWITPFFALKSNFALDINEQRALPNSGLLFTVFSAYLPAKAHIVFELLAILGVVYCLINFKNQKTIKY